MKLRSIFSLLSALITLICIMHLSPLAVQAQDKKASLENTAFSSARIKWNPSTQLPSDIKLNASTSLNEDDFISSLRNTFELSDQLEFVPKKESTDPGGKKHIRYKQHYKGLELARTHYIVHMEGERVTHAHGHLPGEPALTLLPSLSKEEAYQHACSHLGLDAGEARKNSSLMSRLSLGPEMEKVNGKLMLSSGFKEKTAANFRLVYCFDITTVSPIRRYDVEIDAHKGELVGLYPSLYTENIPTTGTSLYNGEVDIVVSDTIFESDWPENEANWHLDDWNAYQESGLSWWMADTAAFTPGGYENDWRVALETDPIALTGSQLQLVFNHRYAMEDPDGAFDHDPNFDGWDGINVRISLDGGNTWQVLTGPVPAYTCSSLWSFGEIHREGPGIPGWAGSQIDWTQVSFDLSAYANRTVNIRFEFASDAGYSSWDDNSLFGWQIDDIEVINSTEALYSNDGQQAGMKAYALANWVADIEGNYRLRETTRGQGIATINAESGLGYMSYVDFVQDTLPVTGAGNRAGVGIHWAGERTYDYFMESFDRNSYDNKGGTIISYADWNEGFDQNNAFWTGSFAAYGIGDGELYGSWGSLDVVAHELTHGVTDHSASLVYRGESGALNESFSDIFGATVEFYVEGGVAGDWLLGEDIYIGPGAIRSMKNPKLLSDPDTYLGENWLNTSYSGDNGGVHTNSGVQNHWFYLLTEGGSGVNDDGISFQVTGIGLDDAASIAYRNLAHYLLPDSRYVDAATYSIQASEDLFGEDSQQQRSVRSAWEAVGIYMDPHLFTSDTLLHFRASLGYSGFRTLTLWNKGIESLDITAFHFSDTDQFRLPSSLETPFQIESGDSLLMSIIFEPNLEGLNEETLTIDSSDPVHPSRTIYLTGLGTPVSTGQPEEYQDNGGIELSVSPNPFGEKLLINYSLPQADNITIEIRDITGKLLYKLGREAAGKETVEIIWDNMPDNPHAGSGGIYILSLRTSTEVLVRKIVRQ